MNEDVVKKICQDVSVPKMIKVRQHFVEDNISPQDIPAVVQDCLKRDAISSQIKPGMSIAITCGSRGVANINIIIKAVVDYVKSLGANPFVFPAMGSHGGATAEGQLQIVNGYGVTEEAMGCPIKASMETKQIATTDDGRPVFIDKYASEADGIILVGRIKAHTQFVGPYESGLMKMAVIGMGKQHGAEGVHAQGFKNMAANIQRYGKAILKNAPVICGVGTIENAYDQTYKLAALTPEEIIQQEPELRFSGVSTGACFGHVGPEALAGGPIGKLQDGDIVEIIVDTVKLEGSLNFIGTEDHPLSYEEGAEVLAKRATNSGVRPDEDLPADTRLWAALQDVSGGAWNGAVYDVDKIIEVLEAGKKYLSSK